MPIDFTAIAEAFKAAVPFIPVTLRLAFIPLFIGMIIGLLIALARFFQVPVLSKCSKFNGCLPTFLRLVRSSSH